jgi:thymidylate kinase
MHKNVNVLDNLFIKTRNRPLNGFYYAIDGTPGTGKTTKSDHIKNELNALGLYAKNIKKESKQAAELGKLIFPFLKGNGKYQMCQGTNARTMSLLVQAYCNELYEKEIVPHLDAGGIVICDRDDILTTSVLQPLVELLHQEIKEEDLFDRVNNYFNWFSSVLFIPDMTTIVYGAVDSFLIRALSRDYEKKRRLYNASEISIIRKSHDLFIWSAQHREHCYLVNFPFENKIKIEEVIGFLPSPEKQFYQTSFLQAFQLHEMEKTDNLVSLEILRLILKNLQKLKLSGRYISGYNSDKIDAKLDIITSALNCR